MPKEIKEKNFEEKLRLGQNFPSQEWTETQNGVKYRILHTGGVIKLRFLGEDGVKEYVFEKQDGKSFAMTMLYHAATMEIEENSKQKKR